MQIGLKYACLLVLAAMLLAIPAQAEFVAENNALPEHFRFDENYYTVYGGPDISATIVGDDEYDRGDSVELSINLMNKGVITGFRSETDGDDLDSLEHKLQQAEMTYESQRTTAIGIVAILTSLDPAIDVKSGPQEAGTLVSGDETSSPVQFSIEISENAPAGEYPLRLDLYYGYQKNIEVSGDNETDLGITNMDVGMWYDVGAQNITFPVYVKEAAEFEIVNVSGELVAGVEGMLYATYANVGEVVAEDATVRISAADPFSTTDDQAYLGSLEPGESAVAIFKLKVDETAVSKPYAINSEVKYEDQDGHSRISDSVKIRTEVVEPESSGFPSTATIAAIGLIAALAVVSYFAYRRFGSGKKGEE
ncbi:hypothetical protein J2755_001369 [Methanohalophilus levihalophilus]|uniref:COG1361 S-layer family protein n=1 Tax=Methanohalophilus levihalophilus TaxID=1431282 RepID=UPI001AE91E7A|nr:hypothetical protein [Methanohalophilus levihalophilus]MBP2030435.1 hypothetical protein [Methanohalophilus levihalophilus]